MFQSRRDRRERAGGKLASLRAREPEPKHSRNDDDSECVGMTVPRFDEAARKYGERAVSTPRWITPEPGGAHVPAALGFLRQFAPRGGADRFDDERVRTGASRARRKNRNDRSKPAEAEAC